MSLLLSLLLFAAVVFVLSCHLIFVIVDSIILYNFRLGKSTYYRCCSSRFILSWYTNFCFHICIVVVYLILITFYHIYYLMQFAYRYINIQSFLFSRYNFVLIYLGNVIVVFAVTYVLVTESEKLPRYTRRRWYIHRLGISRGSTFSLPWLRATVLVNRMSSAYWHVAVRW